MAKWEYCLLRPSGGLVEYQTKDGRKSEKMSLHRNNDDNTAAIIFYLGEQEWEYAGAGGSGLLFKRPIG